MKQSGNNRKLYNFTFIQICRVSESMQLMCFLKFFTTDQLLFSHIYNVELSKEDNRNFQIVILFQLSNLTDQPKADIHLSPKWNISTIILYMATWLSADIKIPVLLRGPP